MTIQATQYGPRSWASKDGPRVAFNLGFWTGAIKAARGIEVVDSAYHLIRKGGDPFHVHGLVAGAAAAKAGMSFHSKDRAWNAFLAELRDPAMIFQVEADRQ